MRKKTIGLVGFFGWGNFGDELFVETYRYWLGREYELRVLNDLIVKPYFSKPLTEVLAGIDAIVIGGGDLVIPWAVSELYWKPEYLNVPVCIVGVGVPTWKPLKSSAIERMAEFFSHPNVRMIEVRDRESAEWIRKNLKPGVEVASSADIVFALPMPKVVDAGDTKILGLVTRDRRGKTDDLTHILRLCEKAASYGYRIQHLVLGILEVGRHDYTRAADLNFPNKELIYSESLRELCAAIGRCSILASMKFHGTVVALSYGVPSLALSPTDKSRNLLRMIERPELLSSLIDQALPERFSPYVARIPSHTRSVLRKLANGTMQRVKDMLQQL